MSTDATTLLGPATRARPRGATRLRGLPRSLWRGRETDAAWVRPSFFGLMVVSAVLYAWNLAASGWSNAFYSAAVQAGATNWEAFFYGSSDAGNSITVDKPPASLWVMELSARIFGLSSWSVLLPEALMGVLTVALVYCLVRRHFAAPAALIAGGVVAVTPVAVLMFRFNNPDALLVLLMTASVYCGLRAIEDGRVRWVLLAGAAIGFGFLTKQLQAFLVIPALAAVFLYASPRRIGTRLLHLLAALGAVVVSAGWWVAIVELVPASARPFIGGSQTNDFLELTFGYNGFGRLTGNETGSVTAGGNAAAGGGAGAWGATGLFRLVGSEFGTQIGWLLPTALAMLVVGVVALWRRPRIDPARATLLLLGATLVVTAGALSFGAGIIHPYYSVALAPGIGGLVGIGTALLWERRSSLAWRIVAAVTVLGTGWWAWALLNESPTFLPWLKVVVLLAAVAAAVALIVGPRVRALATVAIVTALLTAFGGPAAYAVDTTLTPHAGSIPSAGPTVAGGRGGFGGGTGGGMRFNRGGTGTQGGFGGQPGAQAFGGQPGAQGFGGRGGFAPGGTGTQGGFGTRGRFAGTGGGMGGGGGLLGGDTAVASSVTALLRHDAGQYTWVAAAVGSQTAASYQLASRGAVMPIGGFNGSDPSPTLAQFKALVADGTIHYFIGGGRGGFGGRSNGGSSASSDIASWVQSTFTATTVGGVTLYDLTVPTTGSAAAQI
ncbi:glycosyltransferase family 39 protein [uncultured Amnibacterium sp.]|uniref:glycosyltransferase family 39 protein n=1 Tax=uncultured Amnibacterium sp. TaxID=1631851 RepID=UPI0035C94C07